MHKMTALKEIAEFDTEALAETTGIDPVAIYMFEHGMTAIHFEDADALCAAMDTTAAELFPTLSDLFDLVEGLESSAEVQEMFFEPAYKMAMRSVGLDPDMRDWIMVVDLKSGNERRYRISSIEMEKIRNVLLGATDGGGYICFYSDCQQVIIRKNAISELSFVVNASYAPFRSREKAFAATLVFEGAVKPEVVGLTPDGGEDGNGNRPFGKLLEAALNGKDLPPFLQVQTDGDDDERFVSIHGLEAIEIPMGVVFPDIYRKDSGARYVGPQPELDGMDTQGTA